MLNNLDKKYSYSHFNKKIYEYIIYFFIILKTIIFVKIIGKLLKYYIFLDYKLYKSKIHFF